MGKSSCVFRQLVSASLNLNSGIPLVYGFTFISPVLRFFERNPTAHVSQ